MPRLSAAELDAAFDAADLDSVPEPVWAREPDPQDPVRDFYAVRAKWHRYFEHPEQLCAEAGCEFDPSHDD